MFANMDEGVQKWLKPDQGMRAMLHKTNKLRHGKSFQKLDEWLYTIFFFSGFSGSKSKGHATPGLIQEESHSPSMFWVGIWFLYGLDVYVYATCIWNVWLYLSICFISQDTNDTLCSIGNVYVRFGNNPTDGHILKALETASNCCGISCCKHRQKQDIPPSYGYILSYCIMFCDWLAAIFNLSPSIILVEHWRENVGYYI